MIDDEKEFNLVRLLAAGLGRQINRFLLGFSVTIGVVVALRVLGVPL